MKYLLSILLSFFFSEIFSQQRYISIEGTIKGPRGNAAVFTSIRVKRDRNTTCAYSDGNFKLNGVKIGDTLLFTNIGYRQSYFVVDRKYNKLDLTLMVDTLASSTKRPLTHVVFNFNSAYSGSNDYAPVKFSERSEAVLDEKKPDEGKIFTKVEVMPVFNIRSQVFDTSLDSLINKLPKKYKPRKEGIINVYYWIRSDRKIEVTSVESSYMTEVNTIFSSLFEQVTSIYPAIQNGRNIGVFCVTRFKIEIDKDKSVRIKLFTQ